MPKFKSNTVIQDCWSSIGNITFFHRNGQCFYKRKISPFFPGTPAQLEQAKVHHRSILAWQKLHHSVQLQWRELAKSVPSHRPPYDNNHHISGYNLFVSAYHGFVQLGREHVPIPQPFPQFPTASLKLLQIIPDAEVAIIRCRLTLTDIDHPERWHISARIQLTTFGVGCDPSKMRSCMATISGPIEIGQNSCDRVVSFTTANYVTSDTIQAHIIYRLIDDVTGYRNNWIKQLD